MGNYFRKGIRWILKCRARTLTTNKYIDKFNNKNTRKRCETSSKLTVKTPERRHWPISPLFLMFLLLTFNNKLFAELSCWKSEIAEMWLTWSQSTLQKQCRKLRLRIKTTQSIPTTLLQLPVSLALIKLRMSNVTKHDHNQHSRNSVVN